MEVTPIFSVGIGKSSEIQLLDVARELFKDNQDVLAEGEAGLRTTLESYNSTQDCAFLKNQQAVNKLKESIAKNAKLFYKGLGFDTELLMFEVVNLWLNEMAGVSTHKAHSHYGFQVSGCFYVDLPESSNAIKFYTPLHKREHGDNKPFEFNQYNAEFYQTAPKEGDMFFWESLLVHEVPEMNFSGIRRSIAYDLKISAKRDIAKKKNQLNSLDKYIAIYNINDKSLCSTAITNLKNWQKHFYTSALDGKETQYDDDLYMSYENTSVTQPLSNFIDKCIVDYVTNVSDCIFVVKDKTQIRFNRYEVGQNMKRHCDHIHTAFDGERKGIPTLTVLGLLNDDFEGGDFLMFDGKKIELSAGDIIIFPSNFLYPHEVTSVTKGTRYSFVSWAY